LVFLLFEESPQVDAADGGSGGIKTITHLDLFTDLLDQRGRHVEGFGLAIHQDGNLVLGMKALAIGAMAVGAAASALAFDERAGQHVAQRTKAADEPAAQIEVGIDGLCYMTLILVSETREVKDNLRFARMPAQASPGKDAAE
jgi:hypothetical protein